MKTLIFTIFLLCPISVSASQGVHHNNDEKYDCSVANKPSKVSWIKFSKNDAVGNGILKFTWKDSAKAHEIQLSLNGKTRNTADDGKYTLKNVKGLQSVKIRGVSNCGKGSWSKVFKAQP
jgi:hypothetical protein